MIVAQTVSLNKYCLKFLIFGNNVNFGWFWLCFPFLGRHISFAHAWMLIVTIYSFSFFVFDVWKLVVLIHLLLTHASRMFTFTFFVTLLNIAQCTQTWLLRKLRLVTFASFWSVSLNPVVSAVYRRRLFLLVVWTLAFLFCRTRKSSFLFFENVFTFS